MMALNGGFAAEKNSVAEINPGFNPDTGQINPGVARAVPTSSHPQTAIPTQEEARAALKKILGADQTGSTTNMTAVTTGSTTPSEGAAPASHPPGSTAQTVPAKFSKENDTLDRVPIMAFPLMIDDSQRQRIYEAAMGDKQRTVSDAEKLEPTSVLSPRQALDGMHALPESVADIPAIKGLKYVKTKDKVFLVQPANRTVVAEITK
ncbi:MAG TPA: hypothetical protein VHE09_14030 [Rhizomicrobium sp.]|nr:hypothetical protein [Rhizomicrobium sp.]